MLYLLAEIKPIDILGWIIKLALAGFGIALLIGFIGLLVQPFHALWTGNKVSEDSMTVWILIFVVTALAGLIYWQVS
jgi:hypothetical protein